MEDTRYKHLFVISFVLVENEMTQSPISVFVLKF